MNGYTTTQAMRRRRRENRLSAYAQALYYELIAICNEERWSESFCCSEKELCAVLHIQPKTLRNAREALIKAGLIHFRPGTGWVQKSCYSLVKPLDENEKKGADKEAKSTSHSTSHTYNKRKSKTENKRKADLTEIRDQFEVFRKLYPGNKRGLDTEFDNFRKKHKDFATVVLLLAPAIEKQMDWRMRMQMNNKFVPAHCHLKTWINQRCWETELEDSDDDKQIIYI